MSDDPIQMHPGYRQGFWDAQGLTPLFDDASPEYAAGWRAYWNCRELLEKTEHLQDARSDVEAMGS